MFQTFDVRLLAILPDLPPAWAILATPGVDVLLALPALLEERVEMVAGVLAGETAE